MLSGYIFRSSSTSIEVSELEYKVEKDQLDIMNISQKIQVIKMNTEKKKYTKELTKKAVRDKSRLCDTITQK